VTRLPRVPYRPRALREAACVAIVLGLLILGVTRAVTASSLGITLLGSALLTLVSVQAILLFHDCMHQAAFGRRGIDTWIARVIGGFYGVPFHFLRAEHLRHHRFAGLVDGDPEALHLREADAARRPNGLLLAKIADSHGDALLYTWLLQFGQFGRFLVRQVRHRDQPKLLAQTLIDIACMIAVWAPLTYVLLDRGVYLRVIGFGFALPAIAGLALVYKVAKPLHTLMIPFPLAGLPYARRQFCVTRTFETSRVLSLAVCHLSFHLEHHLYPHVSRWDLPRLSRELRPALAAYARDHGLPLAIHDGYLSWIREYGHVRSTHNEIADWDEWRARNDRFAYVSFHAPGGGRP